MSQTFILNSSNFQTEALDFNGIVLVDFYADWCMPCQALAPELEKLADQLATDPHIRIAKLDVEESPELAQKYGVRGIPNVIIFKNGQKYKQLVGLQSINLYKSAITDAIFAK